VGSKMKDLGSYIVADPTVCHGQPTFRGTHISVDDVLRQIASGKDRGLISRGSHGKLSSEAIAEAVQLATAALMEANPRNDGANVRELGQYVIMHPLICHGALTIRGSRVLVDGVLFYAAKDMSLEENARGWPGSAVTADAVAEALELARQALQKRVPALATV